MKTSQHLNDTIISRLNVFLIKDFLWDSTQVNTQVSELNFVHDKTQIDDYNKLAKFNGELQTFICSEGIDKEYTEPLIENLLNNTILLTPEDPGNLASNVSTIQARYIFVSWRNKVIQKNSSDLVIAELRFRVSGCLLARASEVSRPEILVSSSLEGYQESYESIHTFFDTDS